MLVEEWCKLHNLNEGSVKGLIRCKKELSNLSYMEIINVPSRHYSGLSIMRKVRKMALKDPELFMVAFNKYAKKKAKEIK